MIKKLDTFLDNHMSCHINEFLFIQPFSFFLFYYCISIDYPVSLFDFSDDDASFPSNHNTKISKDVSIF